VLWKPLAAKSNGQQIGKQDKYFKIKPDFLGLETLNDLVK
jgi:hypothetical protein